MMTEEEIRKAKRKYTVLELLPELGIVLGVSQTRKAKRKRERKAKRRAT
jgi:hypothetical protein